MSDILDSLKSMDTATLAILGFAAILLIFLLVLIVVTIRILKTGGRYEEDESYGRRNSDVREDDTDDDDDDDDDEDDSDDEEEDEDDDDETSRKIREAVESVEVTKARVEAERIAREMEEEEKAAAEAARLSASEKVEEIAESVKPQKSSKLADRFASIKEEAEKAGEPEPVDLAAQDEIEDEEEYGDDPVDDGDTAELDTDRIVAELKKERKAAKEEAITEMAKQRAEAPEYNASFDSAFVDRPSNEVKKEPIIPNPTPESILGTDAPAAPAPTPGPMDVKGFEAEKKEKPEKKEKKKKKKEKVVRPATPIEQAKTGKVAKYYWYNKQDVEDLTRKEDMYFKSHYFNDADDVILDIITEMYDCGFVKTEELQRIAYGITFKSLGMKEILQSKESLGFNKDDATKEPTDTDRQEAYEKWCGYVDKFMELIVIDAPEEVKEYILDKMYDYGNRDIEDLMYSPY